MCAAAFDDRGGLEAALASATKGVIAELLGLDEGEEDEIEVTFDDDEEEEEEGQLPTSITLQALASGEQRARSAEVRRPGQPAQHPQGWSVPIGPTHRPARARAQPQHARETPGCASVRCSCALWPDMCVGGRAQDGEACVRFRWCTFGTGHVLRFLLTC